MATNQFDKAQVRELPPGADGLQTAPQTVAMGAAANVAIFSGLTAALRPTGQVYVTFAPVGGNLTTFAVGNGNGIACTNSATWADGSKIRILLNPAVDTYMRVAGSAGTLKWWISSQEIQGTKNP